MGLHRKNVLLRKSWLSATPVFSFPRAPSSRIVDEVDRAKRKSSWPSAWPAIGALTVGASYVNEPQSQRSDVHKKAKYCCCPVYSERLYCLSMSRCRVRLGALSTDEHSSQRQTGCHSASSLSSLHQLRFSLILCIADGRRRLRLAGVTGSLVGVVLNVLFVLFMWRPV